jgi:hypothetical protein
MIDGLKELVLLLIVLAVVVTGSVSIGYWSGYDVATTEAREAREATIAKAHAMVAAERERTDTALEEVIAEAYAIPVIPYDIAKQWCL